MNKTLAVIGAGEAAAPIFAKAKEMDVRTVAFGGADSLAKDEADSFYAVSVFDIDAICEICRNENVNGVIASSEITTESAALVANALSLVGNDISGGFAGRNKLLMRQRVAARTRVSQPRFHVYQDSLAMPFPVMIKAADACGKKGITLVESLDDLPAAVAYARESASDGIVLVEEYIPGGQEFSVECICYRGNCHVIQITEKETSGPPHFAEIGHHQPATLTPGTAAAISNCASSVLDALGITCSMAHLELKLKDGCLYFIEVGARAGGDHIADMLVGMSTDFDYYKAAIQCSLDCFEIAPVRHTNYAGIYFHCKHNAHLEPLFQQAKTASWCVSCRIAEVAAMDVTTNAEAAAAGYFVYKADHKITAGDIRGFEPVVLNTHPHAYELLWAHNREIGRTLTDEELDAGIRKFLAYGNAVTILDGNHVVGFLNLYCNNYETLQAYICNVYVLDSYRGQKLSKKLVQKAIQISRSHGFQKIQLHVAEDNYVAISLYKGLGFSFTGDFKEANNEIELEMLLQL